MRIEPEHRSILAVDIEAFGSVARTDPIRLRLHRFMTDIVRDSLARAAIAEADYAISDTGDGMLVSVAPQVSTLLLVDPLIRRLSDRLTAYNRGKGRGERLRMRLSLHAGGVLSDPKPLHGAAVIRTFRLLDSPVARSCLDATERPLVAIVSETVYDDVIKHRYGRLDPSVWHPVTVEVKETHQRAWVHVPGDPDAPLRAAVVAAQQPPGAPPGAPPGDPSGHRGAVDSDSDTDGIWVVLMMPDGTIGYRVVSRREVLVSGALSMAAMTVGPSLTAGRSDHETVGAFRSMFDQLRRLGQVTSPVAVMPTAIAQTHAVCAGARRATPRLREKMLVLASRFADYTGWMAQEAGDDRAAIGWTERAARLAAAGQDPEMATYGLIRRALISLYKHDPVETIELARRAQADTRSRPRILGLAALREAQGHALAGEEDQCRRALARGAEFLHKAEHDGGEPQIGTSFVPDPVATATGWCMHDLGRPGTAAEILHRELGRISPSAHRSRARYGARLALAHAEADDIGQACAFATSALDAAERIDSATVRVDLKDLARTLTRRRSHREVRDLLPRLTAALHRPMPTGYPAGSP